MSKHCPECGKFLKKFVNDDDHQFEWYCSNEECLYHVYPVESDPEGYWEDLRKAFPDDPRLPENSAQSARERGEEVRREDHDVGYRGIRAVIHAIYGVDRAWDCADRQKDRFLQRHKTFRVFWQLFEVAPMVWLLLFLAVIIWL